MNTGMFSTSPFVMNLTIEPAEPDLKEFILYKLERYSNPYSSGSGDNT